MREREGELIVASRYTYHGSTSYREREKERERVSALCSGGERQHIIT